MKIRGGSAATIVLLTCGFLLSLFDNAETSAHPVPVVGVFPVTYLSQQQITGHVVSEAVPVPPAALDVVLTFIGDPVGDPASASGFIEYSCDGGLTWPCALGGFVCGGPLGDPFGTSCGTDIRDVGLTHARAVVDVVGTAILSVTGEFHAPINVDITSIKTGKNSSGVAVNPVTGLVYVVEEGGDHRVSVIDAMNNLTVARIALDPTENHRGVALNLITNRIYIAGTHTVKVIDGDTNAVIGSFLPGPVNTSQTAVAVNPRTNRIYVTNSGVGGASLTVVDGATNSILALVPVGQSPSSVALNPATDRIYVASDAGHPITVIDGGTNTVLSTIATGERSRAIAVDPVSNRLYVSTFTSASLLVIDGRTDEVIDIVPLSGPIEAIAVDAARHRIYAATSSALVTHRTGYVFIIHGPSHKVISAVPIRRPGGIDVLPGIRRVYAGGGGDGIVSSFEDHFTAQAHFPDLAIAESALPDSVPVGTDLQVTFTVTNATNDGSGIATNVTAFLVSRRVRFVSATSTEGTCAAISASGVRCIVAQLSKGESVTITLDVQPETTGQINISGSISADQVDVNATNNFVSRMTTGMAQ